MTGGWGIPGNTQNDGVGSTLNDRGWGIPDNTLNDRRVGTPLNDRGVGHPRLYRFYRHVSGDQLLKYGDQLLKYGMHNDTVTSSLEVLS